MTDSWRQWEGQTVVNIDDQDIHFRLGQYLGGSQRSPVFLTELGRESRKAAIKLLRGDPATSDAQLARWRRIAELSHPHLLRLFQTGRCRMDGTEMLFAVMEYAEEDLSQILPERPLSASETLDMLKPTLEALAYLHGQGFVHGRLKPANIMAVNDQLKLASDGLHATWERVAARERGPYEPPEICGSPEEASEKTAPAVDAWSLGMTLAEALTQNRPSWKQEDQQDPVVPQTLPEPFPDIVRNCLRRDPQQRWTMNQIATQLHLPAPAPAKPRAVSQEVIKARNPSRKWLFIVPAVAASFAAALFAASGILHRQPPAQPHPQTQVREDAPVTEPNPEASHAQKPSPATPMASGSNDRQRGPRVIEASLPSSPAVEEINTTTSAPENGLKNVPKNDGVLQQVLPAVPQKARDTIQGKIRVKVRVHVNAPGDVVQTELDSSGPSPYFAQLALQAAQRWKFTPEPPDAGDASREWLLRFEFGSSETRVFPSPAHRQAR